MPVSLRGARAELRRTARRDRYRAQLPLSAHKQNMTVAIWWESDKLICMGLRYVALEYSKTQKRCGIPVVQNLAESTSGAVRHDAVPPHWRRWLCDKVSALPPDLVASLEHSEGKGLQYQEKARRFYSRLHWSTMSEARLRKA